MITGRLSGRIVDLETFGWMPEAFDAFLYTPPDDDSKHRISQRAVTNLSSIGGGSGGGVAAALQGGFLKFFDDFRYDRLGFELQACERRLRHGRRAAGVQWLLHREGLGPAAHRRDRQPDAGRVDDARSAARCRHGV